MIVLSFLEKYPRYRGISLKGRHFLKLFDYSSEEINYLIDFSLYLKEAKKNGTERQMLCGKNIVLLFEKDSTRTRCAFEVATLDQGAHVTYLGPSGSQMGKKESIPDTARVLGRMYDGIEYRGYGQVIVETLAKFAGVPVWNGLTNEFHPTQAIADVMTIREHFEKPLNEIKLVYAGNGDNNVTNSLMVISAKLGMEFTCVSPKELSPMQELVERCQEISKKTGAKISVTDDIRSGVKNADVIYTDVWVSMGEPEEEWKKRIDKLKPFQVNKEMMAMTGKSYTKFMHCLPAFHDINTTVGRQIHADYGLTAMEVTDDVFESASSIVFDEAENRMHTIKAVMVSTLCGDE
jgi:ornithine carbamoyltransferase